LLGGIDTHARSLPRQSHLPLFISFPDIAQGEPYPQEYYEPLLALWNDAGVQAAHRRAHEIALPENLPFYFASLDRLWQPEYEPSDADLLRCRNKTTGIIETLFPLGDKTYRIFDVGGQRSERKKWIHCFENVTAVLFIVALSGYDCSLVEDQDSNQMQEALMLFESIANSKWFVRTSMIVFLNKVDIFKEKIQYSSIKEYFPDFPDSENDRDYEAARQFFKKRFLKCNRSKSKEVYPNFTNATDPGLLKVVMASVTDIILTASLRDSML
jgi:guanine nucleotide-binding protein subunit alpha